MFMFGIITRTWAWNQFDLTFFFSPSFKRNNYFLKIDKNN